MPDRALLFDGGNTLMREFPEYGGKMVDWPRVEAVPGAAGVLAALHASWTLAVATNAASSQEDDIRKALQRVDLAQYFDKIYCFRSIGYRKPSREFFDYILNDLDLLPVNVVMIGDDLDADIHGASAAGLAAVWLNERSGLEEHSARVRTIHHLSELPEALASLGYHFLLL